MPARSDAPSVAKGIVALPRLRRQKHSSAALEATAHVLLGIRDSGALCSTPVAVDGLKVYPPGQRSAKEIGFPFDACAHKGVLVVGPMRAGVGIPGYSGP